MSNPVELAMIDDAHVRHLHFSRRERWRGVPLAGFCSGDGDWKLNCLPHCLVLVSYSLSFPDPKDLVWNVLLLVLAAGRQGLQVLNDDKVLDLPLIKMHFLSVHVEERRAILFNS